jgi:hypothetical protein
MSAVNLNNLSRLHEVTTWNVIYLLNLSKTSGYYTYHLLVGGTRYRSWLRNYATSRNVSGSIPDEVIGFFN